MTTDQTIFQLDEYYQLNIQHLRWSFTSSLSALISGLIALLTGTALIILGDSGLTGQLVIIGGLLTQFIGAGFFVLYSRNLVQLNIFYDKLIKHKDTLYAISLARELSEPSKSSAMMAVVGNLLARGEPPIPAEVLTSFNNRLKDSET